MLLRHLLEDSDLETVPTLAPGTTQDLPTFDKFAKIKVDLKRVQDYLKAIKSSGAYKYIPPEGEIQRQQEKEKELIKLYGRKDLQKGTLVNLNDGGFSNNGAIRSDGFKQNLSKKMKIAYRENTRKLSKGWLGKFDKMHPNSVEICQFDKKTNEKIKTLKEIIDNNYHLKDLIQEKYNNISSITEIEFLKYYFIIDIEKINNVDILTKYFKCLINLTKLDISETKIKCEVYHGMIQSIDNPNDTLTCKEINWFFIKIKIMH